MTTLNFALDVQKYTVCRALLWGNCAGHFKKAFGCEALSGGRRFVHFLIAALEFIPVIGQIASLFERAIVKEDTTVKPTELLKPTTQLDEILDMEFEENPRTDCPLTMEKMIDPVLLLEEGKTYEKSEITKWFQDHKTSPVKNNEINNPTFVDNRVVLDDEKVFRAPYYCKEMNGGMTAEREEIENWFNIQNEIEEITIYPNDNLFNTKPLVENEEEAVNPGKPVVLKK